MRRGDHSRSDGSIIATAGTGGDWAILLWDAATGELINTLPGHRSDVWNMAFSPDGARIAVLSSDGFVHVWRLDLAARTAQLELSMQPVPDNFLPQGQPRAATWISWRTDTELSIATALESSLE